MEETTLDDPKTYKQAMKTYKQAMKLPDAEKWKKACAAKVESLIENKVFAVVDKRAGKQIVTSKWVFRRRRGNLGKLRSTRHG